MIFSNVPASAATFYWDADGSAVGNDDADGTGLGGTGTWDTATPNWWDTTNLVNWPNTSNDVAVFSGPFTALPTANVVTLSSGIVANRLEFRRGGYQLTGGDLTLAGTSPSLFAGLGLSAVIDSQILGSDGLTMTGGGTIRLGNLTNAYTGTTNISNGSLIITGQSALGASTSPIVVSTSNAYVGASSLGVNNLRGFASGSLVLDGRGGDITISRDLSLQGRGPIGDNGAALVSSGNNTLSGTVDMGVAFSGTNMNTRIIAADGTLNISGPLNVLGTAASTISSLGGINQAGASFYNVTGVLSGTGTLEGSGGGTLFLNPSDSSGFSGTIRVSGSAASGQSVVRIDSAGVLGTRTSGTTGAVLDLNGGILAVLMDAPDVKVANGTNANVYFRTNSTIFADHTPNSSVSDQTVAFGNLSYEDSITLTFNSRNGYGMSFTTAPVNGGNANPTMTNNLQGGALLSFTGNFWSNSDNTGSRTMTIGGNGNTLINGGIIASSAAFDHILSKSGSGTLTLTGTTSTLDGAINITGGTLAISDWRAVTNNTSAINLGSGSTTVTLSVIGNNVSLANLTTSKVINLAGSTGGAILLANQTGTSPGLILNADFTVTGGSASQAKTLTLGGTNIAQNTINGVIPNNAAGGTVNLAKIDGGTWVLAGSNLYTGATTISNGILRLMANDANSTILSDASTLVFNQINQYAGGTLEFVGQPSVNNLETIGSLTVTAGSGTIKLTPGSGGTASLAFDALGAFGGGGTVNIVAPDAASTVSFTTIATTNNIVNAGMYYNGANFAFVPGSGLAVRAPIYGDGLGDGGSDVDFVTSATALTAGQSNEITGSFSNGALTIDSLRIAGAHALDMTGLLTIRTDGTANASGGVIQAGGSGSIGGTGVTTGGSGALVINVDGAANTLTLNAPISGGSGGFTKVGAGTLVVAALNTQTGANSINEGTVRLAAGGRIAIANSSTSTLTIRQGAVLDLNGVDVTAGIDDFLNNGIVTNSGAAAVTFTVGSNGGGGTSLGIVEDGTGGAVSVIKASTGAQTWNGLSTYTGSTTIASTGIVTVNNVANGGFASGIGASSSDASNLVFTGASTSQAYGGLSFAGTTNDFTNRLFTFNGGANGGARIQANGVNGATLSFTNTGALQFGAAATGNAQGLVLGGASTGDNRFFPIINDNGGAVTSVYKADAGIWHLEGTNGYTGNTELRGGTLYAQNGTGLPTASNLVFNRGILASSGTFDRTIGSGANQMRFAAPAANTAALRGGFAAGGSKLTIDWGTGAVWGTTTGFLDERDGIIFGAMHGTTALARSDVELVSDFSLGTAVGAGKLLSYTLAQNSSTVNLPAGFDTSGLIVGQSITGTNIPSGAYIVSINSATQFSMSANTANSSAVVGTYTDGAVIANSMRPIRVDDNTNSGSDFATLSGVISGAAGSGIRKLGTGILVLSGANTYNGETNVNQGTLVVSSLGNSAGSGGTSVGTEVGANLNTQAVTLGNGGTGGAILEYVGVGETSDRKIRLFSTTGSTQIHADGVGPLILTNVANDMVGGAKTLFLRGVNAGGNMITSQLSNNGGNLAITVDSSATWILTGDNDYSGNTSVTGGALGIGHNNALGDGAGTLTISNGTIFAYGGDRTIANPITQSASSGTIAAFTGDYSLTLTGLWSDPSTTSSGRAIRNNIVTGKTLTLAGDYTATVGTTSRFVTFDGSGDTILSGAFTVVSNLDFGLAYAGTGSLTLSNPGNTYTGRTTVTSGTLKLGANEVIPNSAVNPANNVVIMDPGVGLTATFDLNGQNETINGLTANAAGNAVIDNTSATAASLTFGANDQAVSFGGGVGTYTIQNSGGGALSLTKTGTTAMVIPTGVTLTYTGGTNVNGGSMTIASPVNGTSGLSVSNAGSALALTGGITIPSAITSVVAEGDTILSLLDGAGSNLNALTTLQLGSVGGTTTTLNLNVGDVVLGDKAGTDTLSLTAGGVLSLFAGNTITFNLTDAGLNANQQYVLLDATAIGGGFFGGASPHASIASYILAGTPGGFTSMDITTNSTTNQIILTTGNLIVGTSWWNAGGAADNWNDVANWAITNKTGTIPAVSTPGQGTDVVFIADNIVGGAAITTTLEQNFKVNSLTFEASTNSADTPISVTIDPGTVATNRIEIAPQASTDGIKISAGGPATVTISSQVRLGANQTWLVADAASVLSLGGLRGEADVTKDGSGKVTLTAAADPTFNGGVTADVVINAGTLEMTDVGALGNPVNANFATVTINATGAFFYNGAASTATNLAMPLTLNGGTLSAGTANQTYSGTVNISGNSFINLRDSNSAVTSTAARSITLTGVLSGSGSLTVDSVDTLTAGNAETGTLIINNLSNTWDGELIFERGSVDFTSLPTSMANAGHTGDVTFNTLGRLIYRNINGETLNRTGTLTFAAGAIGEVFLDSLSSAPTSDYIVNQNGLTTLGSGGIGAIARFTMGDAASTLNITGGVVLGGDSSISVDGGDADSLVIISSVISDGGSGYSLAINDDAGGWAVSNNNIRLTGLNTFTGNISLSEGILEFDTVTDAGGGASSLGNGTAITMAGGTLSFIGGTSQSTNRPITITSTGILSANGTGGAVITYAGAIDIVPTTSATRISLTGTPGSEGIISGGINQTGDEVDMSVTGGTWTHTTATSRIGDEVTVTGASTIFNLNSGLFQVRDELYVISGATLNLNGTGVLSFNTPTLTSGTLRAYTEGVINLGADDAVVATEFDELRIGVDGVGIGTFNMNAFDQTVTAFIFGNRNLDRSGLVNGTGTLTVTGNFDLYGGTVNANLASTGTEAMEKIGANNVTLTGDNSGLSSTGDTIVYDGILVLDYTLSNTTKINAAQPLDMRGARVNLLGNTGAATAQNVANLVLSSGGSSTIQVAGGSGQDAVLNLSAITRANLSQDGTIRFILPGGTQSATNGITTTSPNSSFGMLGTGATVTSDAAYATVEDGTGTWFATKDIAGVGLGNIIALASTPKNDVTTWLPGDHITDETTGFTGVLQAANINSLRYDAAVGSDVVIAEGGVLVIGSGGFLITSNVGGTPSMMGGTLASGASELVITQDSAQTFEISSDIRINHAVVKTGAGTLRLTGNNVYTGDTVLQEGILQVTGNSIGDLSLVALSASRPTTFQLLASETIGRLSGGQRATDGDYGTVDVGVHTLTINQSSSTTYAGVFTGTSNILKQGPGNLQLTGISSGFIGVVTVDSGMLYFTTAGSIGASTVRVNKGGSLLFDQNGTTGPSSHIADTSSITLNSADGGFLGQAIVRGLGIRTDTNATRDEVVGTVSLNSGANYVGMEATASGADADIIANDIVRLNSSTLNVRGYNLGINNTRSNQFRIGDAVNEAAFIAAAANLVGGGGAAASKNISIVPWAIGENHLTTSLGANNMGNSLVTYVSGLGFRPLDITPGTGEYNTFATLATATDNVRETLAADLAGLASTTVNALVINNEATSTVNVTGNGAGQNLAVTSGAMLFTVTGAAANVAYNTALGGFDAGITVGATNEYVIHVVNPNSGTNLVTGSGNGTTFGSTRVTTASTAALLPGMAIYGVGIPVGATIVSITNATSFEISLPAVLSATNQTYQYSTVESLTATIASPLTSAADITKSGRGTLILSGANVAGGGSNKTTINEGILQIADLDNIGGSTGALVFAGGTLRLASSFADDISQRTITLLEGGGTLDTNGVDLTLGGSIGTGPGGFTKTGAGILTLNAAATYTGPTTILGGMLVVGANNATGNGGALNLGAGAMLDIGANNITTRLLTTFGIDPVLSGTGTITSAEGFYFGNAGNLDVGAVLAGPGGVFKNLADVLTLTGFNTFTGPVELQGGTLAFTTIGNVGEGASSLGAPTTLENGIIRTGLGGTSVSLTYLGGGSITDRIVAMQSTTGNLTINGNGTGAIMLGKVQTETVGDKDLILRGTSASNVENTVSLIEQYVNFLNVIKLDANTWVLSGANNYTGATTAGGGILRAANDLAFGPTSLVTLVNSDAVLELADGITIANALSISGTGNNKTLQLQDGATSADYAGDITILETTAGNFDISAFTGGTLTVSGAIGGTAAAGVTKVNAGTVVLTGANTYTGGTVVSQGILQLGDGATAGTLATASAISIAAGATFSINRSDIVTQGIDFSAAGVTGDGRFEQAGSGTTVLNAANAYTGGTSINAGILRVDSADALGTTGDISFGGGTLQYSANNQVDYSARFSTAAGQAYRIDTNGETVTYATSLTSDGGTLNKLGAGRLTLSAATANTYSGTTTVTEGVLTVDGSLAGPVSVTGGTFNGGISGTPAVVVGAVVVDGGEFSAGSRTTQTAVDGNNGNGVGQMNLGAGLTWNGGSTLVFDFSSTTGNGTEGTNWDFFNITGTLAITSDSSNKITLFVDSWSDLDTYGVVSTFDSDTPESAFPTPSYTWLWAQTGGITDGTNTLSGDLTDYFAVNATRDNTGALFFDQNTTGGSFWVSAVGSNLYINYASVPEPGSMVLIGVAGLGLAAYRRRKRRREEEAAATAELG